MTTLHSVQNKWMKLLIFLGFICIFALYIKEHNENNELKEKITSQKKTINDYKNVCLNAYILLENYCPSDEVDNYRQETIHKINSLTNTQNQ